MKHSFKMSLIAAAVLGLSNAAYADVNFDRDLDLDLEAAIDELNSRSNQLDGTLINSAVNDDDVRVDIRIQAADNIEFRVEDDITKVEAKAKAEVKIDMDGYIDDETTVNVNSTASATIDTADFTNRIDGVAAGAIATADFTANTVHEFELDTTGRGGEVEDFDAELSNGLLTEVEMDELDGTFEVGASDYLVINTAYNHGDVDVDIDINAGGSVYGNSDLEVSSLQISGIAVGAQAAATVNLSAITPTITRR